MVQEVSIQYSGTLRSGSVSVLHVADGFSATDVRTFVAGFMNGVADHMNIGVDLLFDGEIRQIDTATGDLTGVVTGAQISTGGQLTGSQTADNVAAYVRFGTGAVAGTRRLAGGCYISGLSTTAINAEGNFAPAYQADMQSTFGTLLSASPVGLWVVWSRTHGVAFPITSVSVRSKISQQRRRRS